MSNSGSGKCQCGNASIAIDLPSDLQNHAARQCDCDFCSARRICYLSHSEGTLEIECKEPFEIFQQGSDQASFLACPGCGDVVAVVLSFQGGLKGAVNACLLDDCDRLQKPVTVSPKHLDPQQKRLRWEGVWGPVRINGTACLQVDRQRLE